MDVLQEDEKEREREREGGRIFRTGPLLSSSLFLRLFPFLSVQLENVQNNDTRTIVSSETVV